MLQYKDCFVADGQRNLQNAHRVAVEREIQAKYARQTQTAPWLKLLWLKMVMSVEVWSKLRKIASTYLVH